LKIANLNVNSPLKHIEEIRLLLSDTPFDILAINESKRDSSITDYEIHVHNYSIVRLDRNRCWGGVALYIKNTLPYLERKNLVSDNVEMICVEITKQHSRPFLVTT
jgi:exonuclease III